jgi:ELWxxDGT repeat protein
MATLPQLSLRVSIGANRLHSVLKEHVMRLSLKRSAEKVSSGSRIKLRNLSRLARARPRVEELEHRLLLSVKASLIKDLNTQPASSDPANFLTIGSITYFSANDGVHGNELWRTDGTAAGTYMVKDTNPNGDRNPSNFVNFNGELLFQANTESSEQIWKSDGTAKGTQLVKSFSLSADPNLQFLTVVANAAIFVARDSSGFDTLWRINQGMTGAFELNKVQPVPTSEFPSAGIGSPFTVSSGIAFFAGYDATHGLQLWESDGTMAATHIVKDISSGGIPFDPDYSATFKMTVAGSLVFFVANDGVHGNEPWRSDGTPAGTFMVRDINPGSNGSIRFPTFPPNPSLVVFTAAGTNVFFNADDGTDGPALWVSDGTKAGTHIVIGAGSNPQLAQGISASGNGVYYLASGSSLDLELWRSDGTSSGTYMVKQINPSSASEPIAGIATINGLFFFLADDGTHGTEMWVSDGSSGGTMLLQDIAPGSASAFDSNFRVPFAVVGSDLYFMPNFVPVSVQPTDSGKRTGPPVGRFSCPTRLSRLYQNNLLIRK